MWARCDPRNTPATNGEYWLVGKVVDAVGNDALFMDIGANKGDWTRKVLSDAKRRGLSVRVKAFEPSSETRALLSDEFGENPSVEIIGTALSAASGSAEFFSNRTGSGTNSLHSISGDRRETVSISTVDEFLGANDIDHVSFAKIDVEGFDALVLLGAQRSLAKGTIDLIQFEYNWRWILNSQSLRNVFQMIENTPYRLGKLVGDGMLVFDRWHFEMDRFFEGNYVLIRSGGPFESIGTEARYDASNVLRY